MLPANMARQTILLDLPAKPSPGRLNSRFIVCSYANKRIAWVVQELRYPYQLSRSRKGSSGFREMYRRYGEDHPNMEQQILFQAQIEDLREYVLAES